MRFKPGDLVKLNIQISSPTTIIRSWHSSYSNIEVPKLKSRNHYGIVLDKNIYGSIRVYCLTPNFAFYMSPSIARQRLDNINKKVDRFLNLSHASIKEFLFEPKELELISSSE